MTRGKYDGLSSGSLRTEADFYAAGVRFSSDGHPPVPKMRVDDLSKTQADALLQKALAEIARRSERFAGKTGNGSIETLWLAFSTPYSKTDPKTGICLICGEPRYMNYLSGDCFLCIGAWRVAVKKSGYVAAQREKRVLAPAAPVITLRQKAPWE
jgi:hypothetical protein